MAKVGKAKILCEAEFKQLLINAKIGPFAIRNVAILYCSFGLGMNAKEIASLTLGDVADHQYKLRDKICLKRKCANRKQQYYAYLVSPKVYGALTEHLKTMTGIGFDKPFFKLSEKDLLHLTPYKNGLLHFITKQERPDPCNIYFDLNHLSSEQETRV